MPHADAAAASPPGPALLPAGPRPLQTPAVLADRPPAGPPLPRDLDQRDARSGEVNSDQNNI